MDKSDYRKVYLEKREALSAAEQAGASSVIAARLIAHPVYLEANVIMAYAAIRGEVITAPLIEDALAREKTVCLPVTDRGARVIRIAPITSLDGLMPSDFGVPEPQSEYFLNPKDLDLIIVPGLAFDRAGYRLGYGGGYYDRILVQTSAPTVGLCNDICFTEELPYEAHDIPVTYVMTESRTITI